MAERDDARSYSDRGALREPSRPKAFDLSDDEAVIRGCQQAIQSSKALLLRASEASMRSSPTVESDHHDGDLLQVFYSSRVPKAKNLHQTQDDIDNILRISRKENAERGITGILVANMKMYSQIIEGPSGYIKELVGRISCDARHHDIRVISRDIAKTRLFPDWSMSFMLTDLELEIYNDTNSNLYNKKASDILSFCSSIGIKQSNICVSIGLNAVVTDSALCAGLPRMSAVGRSCGKTRKERLRRNSMAGSASPSSGSMYPPCSCKAS